MLNCVRKAMAQAGLIGPDAELDFNVTVSTGDTITMDVRESDGRWYHVKLSQFSDLYPQFEKYRSAYDRFPAMVPEALAHSREGRWNILICRLIHHQALRAADLDTASGNRRLVKELIGFFVQARTNAAADAAGMGHGTLLRNMRDHFAADNHDHPLVSSYLERSEQALWAAIPYIPQHGDFVLNNLGCADGHLAIFDWEDFGDVGLAGFDLCMLSMSLGGLTAETAIALYRSESAAGTPWGVATAGCEASGLPYQVFRSAVPIYLLVFRYLKRNYGSTICQRIDDILKHLVA